MKYANAIRTCPLSCHEALIAYLTFYLPSITYPLPACTISQSALRQIDQPMTNAILSKLGFIQKFPREVAYSPRHFGGIGLRDLYCKQGIGHLKQVLNHIRANNKRGKRLLINIDQYQLLAGISTPVLEQTHTIPGTRNVWLSHLRLFLRTINCQLCLHQPWTFPALRTSDVHLMDVISISTTWTNHGNKIFNMV